MVTEIQVRQLFTPHCINLRTGPLPTLSELFNFWRYLNTLEIENRFGIIIDDKVFEDASPDTECSVLDLALGLGCEYLYVKGVAKPERVAKIYAYAEYLQKN